MPATRLVRNARKSLRERGTIRTLRRVPAFVGERLFARIFHRRLSPQLKKLEQQARGIHLSGDDLLLRYVIPNGDPGELRRLREEFTSLEEELNRRRRAAGLRFPGNWALGESSAFVLYAVTRTMRPKTVLETGVADGVSSFFCLSALIRNGSGSLHSVDVVPGVGSLLNDEERRLWHLTVMRGARVKRAFAGVVKALPPIDLFIQDSDHVYGWQAFELATVSARMSRDSLILADDVDTSFAFLDFATTSRSRPIFLVETTKVAGLLLPADGLKAR